MKVYPILLPEDSPEVLQKIKNLFPGVRHFTMNPSLVFVTDKDKADIVEMARQIGLRDDGSYGVVISVSDWYGFVSDEFVEWLRKVRMM